MKNRTLFLSTLFFYTIYTLAQQIPHYSQYLYNMQIINPAYIGNRADISIALLSRSQWIGVEGAPTTQTFAINARTLNGLGIGTTVVNDKIGLLKSTNLNIDASYTLVTSRYGRLSLGIKGGLTFFNNNLSQGITPDNEIYNTTNGTFPNFGLGVLYYNQNFYAGLSVPYLFGTPLFKVSNTNQNMEISKRLNYFLATGVRFEISENWMFKPSTLIKYTNYLPLSVDINSNFLYKKNIEFGFSYRYKDAAGAMFAFILKEKFRIGYAYEHTLTNLGDLDTHEIILQADFNLKRNKRWLYDTRCYF